MANALQKFKSTRGILEWVTITGEGKENLSGKMKYLANVVLDPKNNEADAACIKSINDFWAENKPKGFKKKAKSLGYRLHDPLLDEDGEETYDEDGNKLFDPEGRIHLTFATDTTYPSGDPKVVKTYNAKANVISLGDKSIGNGSVGIISGMMGIYTSEKAGKILDAGVTLYLNGIQLIKFVEYDGADDGFDAVEDDDGFTGIENDEGFESEESANVRL